MPSKHQVRKAASFVAGLSEGQFVEFRRDALNGYSADSGTRRDKAIWVFRALKHGQSEFVVRARSGRHPTVHPYQGPSRSFSNPDARLGDDYGF
ncbi:hypothetical protein C0581_05400 [Candidatus Parcubacteria bacterium]|nr:MAG: hypothetical protein C0581_05400 [Candidatus Parcubacteria bacterium]